MSRTTIGMHGNEESQTVACDSCPNVLDPGERIADDAPWNDAQAISVACDRGWRVDIFTDGLDRCPDCMRADLQR